ncbi:MAG: hypothetical protein Q7R66_14915 [Undibacterium sp.]|uniref:hypothetical protein n=1 Tax=Undibacterium sp. TaxID=1914977 RepID=UPI002723478A|nr:hypothetical protein [Undibacterium sp.]MDO8653474.1 hypothetical protein [Undibacterium sp.]
MTRMSQDDQEKLLAQVKKSARKVGTFNSGDQDIEQFKSEVINDMLAARGVRPWIMCLFMSIYGVIVNFQERKLNALPRFENDARATQEEIIERFRFAANFGRPANATQRKYCFDQIKRFGISPFDAPFLVWSGTMQLKNQKIVFGNWDWISGFIIMVPLYFLIFFAVCTCLCDCLSPATKAFNATIYLAEIVLLFNFYKAQSFDVYKIGSKYFKAHGWGFTPQ